MGRITLYVSSGSGDRIIAKQSSWAKQVLEGNKLPYYEVCIVFVFLVVGEGGGFFIFVFFFMLFC
jgi:hypothetical protein